MDMMILMKDVHSKQIKQRNIHIRNEAYTVINI